MHQIGQLNEQPLHHGLKQYFAGGEGQTEVRLAGYVIDVVLGEQLIEIQTGNFSAIRQKMQSLASTHPVRLVYPVAVEKWLIKGPKPGQGDGPTRRKSPKKGRIIEVFNELVSFPELMQNPNFSLAVVLIREEELREYREEKRWRQNGWKTTERRLLDVVDCKTYRTPADLAELLPQDLSPQFTTAEMAEAMRAPRRLAQKTAYCLRQMDVLTVIGKRGRSNLYAFGGKD